MKYSTVFVTLLAGYVAAQSGTASSAAPTSTAGLSPCIAECSTQAAQDAGCSSLTDTTCVCTNTDFQSSVVECLQTNCPDEMAAAMQLQQQICGASSASQTGSATDSEEPTDSGSVTSAPATSSPAMSSSAMTSRPAVSSISSRASSAVGSASSVIASISSHAASATGSGNSAAALPVFNFAAAGVWAAVAVGGAAAAQLML
ncbi:hypothetical protein FRC12_003571 [Ceratobasidium sp. 428]|nr:hypothetical protein FRC12_003571 [Ceratobasidium sp. 428]